MAGLDRNIIDRICWTGAIDSINTDLRSDFILSPHYDSIFQNNSERLIDQAMTQLRRGDYNPRLPYTISVPKAKYLTRPGSILEPFDRLIYQALVNFSIGDIEDQMDRTRSFSHVPSNEEGMLFRPSHEGWSQFESRKRELARNYPIILQTDIANYFEHIPQHSVINMLTASGVSGGIVNLLEEQLLSFRQRSSSGIIQGIYPSDVIGNFYLSNFDSDCSLQDLESARYVDDIYIGFNTELDARRALVRIIERLRQDGLSLNEQKTNIRRSEEFIDQEDEIENMFELARIEIEDEIQNIINSGYGFQGDWINQREEIDPERIEVGAVNALLNHEDANDAQLEKIERFCLPILRGASDDSAVDRVLDNLFVRPQLTRLYASYLTHFTNDREDIATRIERVITEDNFFTDYQRMYVLAAILNCDGASRQAVRKAIQWLSSGDTHPCLRALCAIFASKFGSATDKRAVRVTYESDASEYVRSAILFSAQYFPTAEKRHTKTAWSRHNEINALIGDII